MQPDLDNANMNYRPPLSQREVGPRGIDVQGLLSVPSFAELLVWGLHVTVAQIGGCQRLGWIWATDAGHVLGLLA